jgi:hypothetical protein
MKTAKQINDSQIGQINFKSRDMPSIEDRKILYWLHNNEGWRNTILKLIKDSEVRK